MNKIKNHAKLLAEMVPPRSNPAGSRPLKAAVSQQNLQSWSEKKEWPDPRPEVSKKRNKRWLHGDYKDAPPFLTHKLYRALKDALEAVPAAGAKGEINAFED